MDPVPMILVLISAVSHGIWNYLAKEGNDKESYMLLLNISSLVLFIPFFYFILPEIYFPLSILPYLLISGIAETVYFLGLGKAYETGDLSLVYPVARSSPVLVSIAAYILLDEEITGYGFLGILVIFLGVYILHLKELSTKDLLAPIRYLTSGSSRYALLAALGTTVYSISDKIGVTTVEPLLYSFWLGFFITGMLSATTIYRRGLKPLRAELDGSVTRITLAGVLMKGGYLMILYAMSLAQVSYILSLRQISVVFGSFLGVVLLNEKYGRVRLIGSVIIFFGVYILGALA
jgi:phosphonate utilization associated putative membrane protein